MKSVAFVVAPLLAAALIVHPAAQQAQPPPLQQTPEPPTPAQRGYVPDDVPVRAIEPPARPLPAEADSAR